MSQRDFLLVVPGSLSRSKCGPALGGTLCLTAVPCTCGAGPLLVHLYRQCAVKHHVAYHSVPSS